MSQWQQTKLLINTSGRGASDISAQIQSCVDKALYRVGLVHVFLQHTSASLMLCENADPTVLLDMEMVLSRLALDGDPNYQHDYEGDDDMAAHVRSVLTSNDLTLPIVDGRIGRTLLITLNGE